MKLKTREIAVFAMLGAIMFGHEKIKELIAFEEEIVKEVGKVKREIELYEVSEEIRKDVEARAKDRLIKAIQIQGKLERCGAIDYNMVSRYHYVGSVLSLRPNVALYLPCGSMN